jgi:hypothetical protein
LSGNSENHPVELVFPVISDIHIKRNGNDDLQKLSAALDQLNRIAPHQDALAVVGDLTHYGTLKEYSRFFDVFNHKKQSQAEALYAMGNHEYLNCLPSRIAQNRFLKMTGLPSIYYHRVIKGYHFIVLSPENRTKHGYYSFEQIRWLSERLKQATHSDPNKPIFVFFHHPLRSTVYGSEEWGIEINAELLYRTLKSYPQVITFSGHSHYPLDDPRSIHQEDFTSVGTSSISYMELEKGKVQGHLPAGYNAISQGLLVEVYPHEVVMKRRSFQHDQWIGSPWIVPVVQSESKFLYTTNKQAFKPSFSAAALISLLEDRTTASRLAIELMQGATLGIAHSYRVTAVEKQAQSVHADLLVFSEFYKRPTPGSLIVSLTRLKPETEYEIQVTAIDSYGNESEKCTPIVGKTKRKNNVFQWLRSLLRQKKRLLAFDLGINDKRIKKI